MLHGVESTTSSMLAQFAAGLAHFTEYKRCKVMGDLLGVSDVTKPPRLDYRATTFLCRLVAELRNVSGGMVTIETEVRTLDALGIKKCRLLAPTIFS